MIAHNPDSKITDIYYYEIKSRLTANKETINELYDYVTIHAHNSLLHDEQIPNEGIADFLSRYYYEKSDYDNSIRYADIVKNPTKYIKHFELFFVIEKSKYIEEILISLNTLPPALHPLNITVVLIENLNQLITETQGKFIESAVGQVYSVE
jgi:hypothetical protein